MNKKSVVEELQRQIYGGTLAPGFRIPSERVLATRFGVSRGTIQSAIRELETQGLLERERNCCPVVANHVSLPRAKTGGDQIAVWLLTDQQDLGGTMILHGIQATLGVEGYRMLLGSAAASMDTRHAESRFLESLIGNPNIAGAIIWHNGNPEAAEIYNRLQGTGIPLVFVDREPPSSVPADLVAIHGRRAAKNMVRHLTELGHRRIGLVLGEERVSSVQDRVDGYEAGMTEAGLGQERRILELEQSNLERLPAATVLLQSALSGPNPPTALMAVNDRIALTLVEAAKAMGIAVPGHLSIAGFDWLMRWLPNGGDLTTVAQPFHEIGAAAAQRLMLRIVTPYAEPPVHLLLDGSIIVRKSTGKNIETSSFGMINAATGC